MTNNKTEEQSQEQKKAIEILSRMLSPEIVEVISGEPDDAQFGSEMGKISFDALFSKLWTRPGLNCRDRSLITVSMLIALRANSELEVHIPAALKNGVSREELEEVIYHSTAYVGFPAASLALSISRELLDE